MTKAFTKESDYDPTAEVVARPLPVLPSGVKSYFTLAGAEESLQARRRDRTYSGLAPRSRERRRIDRRTM